MRPEDNFMKTPALRAQGIARGVLRLLQAHDFSGLQEMSLGNGRRADIVALGRDGEIRIIEIKSSVADFRSDSKWPDYQPFCDRMYFAVAEEIFRFYTTFPVPLPREWALHYATHTSMIILGM